MVYNKVGYGSYKSGSSKSSADKYRVRSMVKSFRDLEVYQKTIWLSNEILSLSFLSEEDKLEIKKISEEVPKLIAESYGDKFDSKDLAREKMTKAVTLMSDMITKIDLLRGKFSSKEEKEDLDLLLTRYQLQKRKILNLRNAWDRFAGYAKKTD